MTRRAMRFAAAFAALTVPATALVALPATAYADSGADIKITEVEYNGSEFVELTNVGSAAQDFTGWSFDDDSRVAGTVSLSAFGTVAPGESVILAESAADAFRTEWGLAGSVKVIGSNPANLGRADEVNVFDETGTLVDRLTYNDQAAEGDPAKGPRTDTASAWVSADALGANTFSAWTKSTAGDAEGSWSSVGGYLGSPGESTLGASAPGAAADVKITEVEYNGSEFVELTNLGTAAQDFTGWSFDDDSRVAGTVSLSAFGTVGPGESVILAELSAADFRTAWGLVESVKVIGSNGTNLGRADEVNVFDETGTLVDRVTYNDQAAEGDPAKGPRTDKASAWVGSDAVGANTFSAWTLSTVGDAQGSWAAVGDYVGSPGASTLGTSTPADVRDTEGGGGTPGPTCQPQAPGGTGPTPSGALTWPGSDTPTVADNECAWKTSTGPEGRDISGLVFDPTDSGVLWAVKNKGWIFKLVKDSGVWVAAPGWEGGKQLFFPGGAGEPDSEGLTVGPDGALYVTTERNNNANTYALNSVLRFDPTAAGSTLTATRQWDLTAEFPELVVVGGNKDKANLGFEGITFVPDSYLTANGFIDQSRSATYRPSNYPLHGSGLYFAALENDGKLYAYALNSDSTFNRIAVVDTGLGHVMDAQYDADLRRIWALCDNTCGVTSALLKVDATGAIVPDRVYARPANLPNDNIEGFAVAAASTCVSGVREVVWGDDGLYGTGPGSAGYGHALYSGTISCDLGLGGQGVPATPPTTPSTSTPSTASPSPSQTATPTPTPTSTATPTPIVPSSPAAAPSAFTPPPGRTNPVTPSVLAPGLTLVSHAVASQVRDTNLPRAATRTLRNAPMRTASAGRAFQLRVPRGLPANATVTSFLVKDGQRIPLATQRTTRTGALSLPALRLTQKGTYSLGIQLPDSTVRWIKVRIG